MIWFKILKSSEVDPGHTSEIYSLSREISASPKRTPTNNSPEIIMTATAFNRFEIVVLNAGELYAFILHNWFKESRITANKVVETKVRKKKPPKVIYQLLARCLNPCNVALICSTLASPTISAR
jgi:hypothetical protein